MHKTAGIERIPTREYFLTPDSAVARAPTGWLSVTLTQEPKGLEAKHASSTASQSVLADPLIAPKFPALCTSRRKLTADRRSSFVDRASVGMLFSSVKDAAPPFIHSKRHLAEMSWLELSEDVRSSIRSPLQHVFSRNKDGSRTLETTGTTFEAVVDGQGAFGVASHGAFDSVCSAFPCDASPSNETKDVRARARMSSAHDSGH
jgi:hypothetical protein